MRVKRGLCAAAIAALCAAPTAFAGGFALHEHGSKAILFGGAFAAQANDLSAMFYNPAGLAQVNSFDVMAGVTLIPYFSEFDGRDPYPGEGYHAEMETQIFYPPHLYAAFPLSKGFVVGLGIWSPYGLSTSWDNPNDFKGRYLSQRVDLKHFAVGLQLAYQISDAVSIGVGPELRLSEVKLQRNASVFDPYSNRFVDAAHVDIHTNDSFETGWSFGAGIQVKPSEKMKIGVAYHHKVDIEYNGTAVFYPISTGHADLDQVLASRLPFNKDVPVTTTVQFPSITLMGLSYDLTPKLTAEFDAYFTEWQVFTATVLAFGTVDNKPIPTSTLEHNWTNAWRFSGGFNYQATEAFNFGIGGVYDETPQPDSDVGALLPDANRTGFTVGVGLKLGKATHVEVSNMALFFHERPTRTNKDNFNGTYKTFADLFVMSLRHSF